MSGWECRGGVLEHSWPVNWKRCFQEWCTYVASSSSNPNPPQMLPHQILLNECQFSLNLSQHDACCPRRLMNTDLQQEFLNKCRTGQLVYQRLGSLCLLVLPSVVASLFIAVNHGWVTAFHDPKILVFAILTDWLLVHSKVLLSRNMLKEFIKEDQGMYILPRLQYTIRKQLIDPE